MAAVGLISWVRSNLIFITVPYSTVQKLIQQHQCLSLFRLLSCGKAEKHVRMLAY